MKLYDLPRGSHFRIIDGTNNSLGAMDVNTEEVYWLGNIDGMYSYCKDSFLNVVHISAWAEVEAV